MRRTNILTNDMCLTCKSRAAHLDCWSGRSHKIVKTSAKVLKNSINKKQKRAPLYFAASSGELWGDDNTCDRISDPRTIAAMTNCIKAVTLATPLDPSLTPPGQYHPLNVPTCIMYQHLEIHKIGSGTFVVVPIVNHKNIWLRKKSPSLVGSRFEKHGGASGLRSWLRHLLAPILSQLSTISSTTPQGGSGSTPRFTCSPTKLIHILFYTSFKVAVLRMGVRLNFRKGKVV